MGFLEEIHIHHRIAQLLSAQALSRTPPGHESDCPTARRSTNDGRGAPFTLTASYVYPFQLLVHNTYVVTLYGSNAVETRPNLGLIDRSYPESWDEAAAEHAQAHRGGG
jgi:hypothetical protein